MALNRITGPGVGLGGVQFQALAGGNELNLQGGQAYVFPAGQYIVTPGPYSQIQVLDPITGIYRSIAATPNTAKFISADGHSLWLCYSGNFSEGTDGIHFETLPPGGRYAMCRQEVRLLTPDDKPTK